MKIGIEFCTSHIRRNCHICGQVTEKWGASVTIEIPEEDYYIDVICVECLEVGILGAAARARDHANHLREWADRKDVLANILESAGEYHGWIDRETFELAVKNHEERRQESAMKAIPA